MNDFGNLAYDIVKYQYEEYVDRFPICYVSGWLETNLGELNGYTHEEFYIDDSGNIGPSGLEPVEEVIFRKMYDIHFYNKASSDVLRGIVWSNSSSADWISIKEGDSSIQRVNKNSVSRNLLDSASQAKQELDKLIFQYNMQKSSPLQVAGTDGITPLEAK